MPTSKKGIESDAVVSVIEEHLGPTSVIGPASFAVNALGKLKEAGVCQRRTPEVIAAACIYRGLRLHEPYPDPTQEEVAEMVGVSRNSVSNAIQDLKDTYTFGF